MAPTVSHLLKLGLIEAIAYAAIEGLRGGGAVYAQTKDMVPAPESAHAIRAAIDEAIQAREEDKKRVILFNMSGHGLLDLTAYDAYFSGSLKDE